jgi:flagellar protein FlgJ
MNRNSNSKGVQTEKYGGMSDRELLDVCYEMESIFVGQMLKTMRKTVMETDFFGKSMAKDIFNDMLYDEYAKLMAKSDAFGLARQIYDQLR